MSVALEIPSTARLELLVLQSYTWWLRVILDVYLALCAIGYKILHVNHIHTTHKPKKGISACISDGCLLRIQLDPNTYLSSEPVRSTRCRAHKLNMGHARRSLKHSRFDLPPKSMRSTATSFYESQLANLH